jgi:hypothetical protein
VQALKAIGEKNMTDTDGDKFGALIQQYSEPETYETDLKAMPTWIRRIFLKYKK